jgi:glutamate-1-semialdehyde 2,1-aminomutase
MRRVVAREPRLLACPIETSTTVSAVWARARGALAGGVDSPVRAGLPVGAPTPLLVSAYGAHVVDAAGRRYIDYLCAYGPVLLGHGDARIALSVSRAMRSGAVVGATHPEEVRLAERVQSLFPSMQRLRFVSTGTEACMSALRVARAFTRREKCIRFEGCYHGHSDAMIFSAGASSLSEPSLGAGVTAGVAGDVIVLPFNDSDAIERALAIHAGDVAAIIIEPICGNMGLCLPVPGYLEQLRAMCSKTGVVLIFDEVITGLRVAPGGAQSRYGTTPDLTCIGKTLGGGLPIAAFGGRADIMATLAPEGPVFVGGTFSGNPVCVAAAHALLDALAADPGFYGRVDALARRLADGLARVIAENELGYPVTQCASMVDLKFRHGAPHRNMNQAREADSGAYAAFYQAMLERGVLLPPSRMELMFLTGAHTVADIDATIQAAGEAMA